MIAPGWPGNAPTWASSAKDLVSTALGSSRVWFTVGYGILNEVFWPSCGLPQIRDLGFIVAGNGFWSEVKREHRYRISTPDPAIPLALVRHETERYQLRLEFIADPVRDVVFIRYQLHGEGLRLYTLLAPHLGSSGHDNDAWVNPRALMAAHGATALALMADGGMTRASAGYVGVSDGWQDFDQHGAMTWRYDSASGGNVALTGELAENQGTLALAFAETPEGAQTLARSALASGYDVARERFTTGWRNWSDALKISAPTPQLAVAARRSAMVLKVHGDRTFRGAVVASLSTPWGASRDDPGGYHLVWPRDAVEAGFAFLACGRADEAHSLLAYLIATQQPDGHWLQNNFSDGRPFWTGIQLDETAMPVLLAAKLDEVGKLGPMKPAAVRMVRAALTFIARTGPTTPQDRWEENAGINPFTITTLIAALVAGAAAGFLDEADRDYALSLADDWNARIEQWVYVSDTELDRRHGIRGHYVRVRPAPAAGTAHGQVELKNRNGETLPVSDLIGLEFFSLVRFGLRHADDPRIRDTVKLADALLRVTTPTGVFYHRYNEDGYGEHADGGPFDGTGIGRAWPLLSGERGHYAVSADDDPLPYLESMLGAASEGGMIPEQVWDAAPLGRRFAPGRPSGSAMPLVWAHAEFLKLAAAAKEGAPIERLEAVADRYREPRPAHTAHWRDDSPSGTIAAGRMLCVEATEPFELHFGHDGWQGAADTFSSAVGLGLHGVRLDPGRLTAARTLEFTRRFLGPRGWEGRDWQVCIAATT
ncbi:MAG: glucan 1,4-alpha-glucosidase [Candidimonas sp.]|nr:MAG: glucan 1,4-alpha-glucosidase [Candidimonas sp.]